MSEYGQGHLRSPETDALADWIHGVTGREMVAAHFPDGGQMPDLPYATVVLQADTIGWPETEVELIAGDPVAPLPNLTEKSTTLNELWVSMNFMAGDPSRDFKQLRASLGLTKWKHALQHGGLGFSRMVGPRDLSEIVKDDWMARQQADLYFYMNTEITADTNTIETIVITNNIVTPPSVITIP